MRIITYFLYCFTGGPLLSTRLYAPQQKASFLDFSADENGLWTIMGMIKILIQIKKKMWLFRLWFLVERWSSIWTNEILGLAVDNNTVVTKWYVDDKTVQPQFMWNISLSHHQVRKNTTISWPNLLSIINGIYRKYILSIFIFQFQIADMFIVCGVLYGVDHVDIRDTKIR